MSDKVINAVTKNRQSDEMIRKMTERAIGTKIANLSIKELAGGLSNAVYLVEADGTKMVLKIASAADVITMRHEKDYVINEAEMLNIINSHINIKAPKVIYFDRSGELCDVPYFFMSFIEGKSLATLDPRPTAEQNSVIKKEIGRICSQICSIKAEHYGIPAMPETYTDSNSSFVLKVFEMLLQDAADKNLEIPNISPEQLMELIEQNSLILDEADGPCLIHTDTWDGNIMVQDGMFTGLVDYAAILYGDPLMTHDFHDFGPEPGKDFLEGFGKLEFSKSEQIRIIIYKIWQRLGMIVERGFRNYDDPGQYAWVLGEFTNAVNELKSAM